MRLLRDDSLESANARLGTRFWIYPQPPFIPGYEQPDRVWLSIPRDEIGAGPSDVTMYVVDPAYDKQPYGFDRFPPFEGERRPPARPGPDRHFDNMVPGSRPFLAVHAYACVRFVLDIWQSYLGRPIRWFFDQRFPRLEIVAFVDWDNAQAGYGFLELGCSEVDGIRRPYALNFDTIAHEVGHLVMLSETGIPSGIPRDDDFFSFSEAFADIVSLISFLHFDSAIDRLLRRTRGNLLLYNELNRFAETSPETQIRLATNFRQMHAVTREVHDRALPFIGAIFDSIVDLYHRDLVANGCADGSLLDFDIRELARDEFDRFRQATADAFGIKPLTFKRALTDARDAIGQALALSLRTLDPNMLTLAQAASAVIDKAGDAAAERLESNFVWREII
ncbi:hypothetical protein [Sinorhizobium alkalisoli]|uniref:Uncharacterized protein n=1 Tax=Sinorhizobium alkalisoli TaxID=1752398 RepID=A0A1E3V617_9HYPH|nr:hypothetical protein [Sinorhizobium alkalisoli]MCA1491729.1 hypothetical protein [Ensifer sp. NBAIM29]MCG5480041.1 hypothetical protein [Sinorhizobium alkalisoli]ODR88286.1 hypothetical protein A8M32_27475 [Sinorhizobium alkalisoli]QFI66970.1 hypothetical protein EKH55_2096 [Sinorhizobium alkalisoli]